MRRSPRGRRGSSSGWTCFSPRTELAGAARAARELLLGLLDGPPGGTYVEGRDDRPWLDPEA
ncbi:hypothetical protein FXW78_03410 [Rhodococcus opacus]|nr:hypothetical protein [Rhodococcus opacus]RZL73948.1 MAG: hypothetical protein EOP32_35985 [Rhodococcus sp. (in: high G+C Gram-positive bacteria)]